MEDNQIKKDKVFFITSYHSSLDGKIHYSLSKLNANGIVNFKSILKKQQKYKKEDYTINVFYFEILPEELRENYKDIKSKKYKTSVYLKYDKFDRQFEGIILFKENKNNFIYDFKFNDYIGWTGKTSPPEPINYSKLEQLKIFNEVLKVLKAKQTDKLYKNLVLDSQGYITGQPFFLDFYLQILKSCYTQKEVKTLLMMFKLERVKLPENIEIKEFSNVLNLIEKKPDKLTKFCTEKDNPEKYLKIFYIILLYFRMNYEKEKVKDFLSNKNYYKYLIDILPTYYKYFLKLVVPDELISEILHQKNLSYKIILNTFCYGHSIENILSIINKNCEIISNCCIKEKQKIIISDISNPKPTDDLSKIVNEIKTIINYQIINKKIFILFDEEFWNIYIEYNEKKIKNLVLIDKAMILSQKIDNSLNLDKLELKKKIHNNGLLAIEKGELKNEDLIEFIENDDIYFRDKDYETKQFRPLCILKGIDLEKADDKFCEKFQKSKIFKIYSFNDYEFKKEFVNIIEDMKDFGKFLKLFDFKDSKIFDYNFSQLLSEKFKNLIKTYKIETCPNFIQDVCLFIYINAQRYKEMNHNINEFLKNIIEINIKSFQTLRDIYVYLFNKYKDLSEDAIDSIANYFTNNKDKLNRENILFLLQNFNSDKFIKIILNKINSCIIKEEELFSNEKDIDSFILLDEILKLKILQKYPETHYFKSTDTIGKKILNDFKTGNIKYSLFSSMWSTNDKKNIIKNRINIILYNNANDIEICMKELDDRYKKIMKIIKYLSKLSRVLKEFFPIKHKNNIILLNNLEKQIKGGKLNDIENDEIKSKIDEMHKIIPDDDLDKKAKLKISRFFTSFFNTKKLNNLIKKEDEIFNETEKDFIKLKTLFEDNWINKIDEIIIKDCYKELKNMNDAQILSNLKFLRNYFELKDINDLYLDKLLDEIKIFSKKEEIFQVVNSCIHFISEFKLKNNDNQKFGVKKTEFFDSLIKLRDELPKNISVEKIKEYGLLLEKFGIKIINQIEEDKNLLSILISLYAKEGSLSFILKITDEDCRHLQEMASECENTFLTSAEIQDMAKCSNFIHNLGDLKETSTDQELIKILKSKINEHKNISVYFAQYTNNYGQIQELFTQKLDKSQAKIKQIKDIIKKSIFTLSYENNKEIYLTFNGKTNNEELNKEKVLDLRNRAMLTKKFTEQTEEEKKTQFAERMNEIEKIYNLLIKIANKGYSEDIIITVEINEGKSFFYSTNNKYKDYTDCIADLNNILKKTCEAQINYYKNEKTPLIRYIYGRQFNLLSCYLKHINEKSLAPFLKFLTNDQIKNVDFNKIDYDYNYELNKDKYICLLENIDRFLNSFLSEHKINLEEIYKQNIIIDKYKNEFKGLYTYLREDDKIGEVQKGIEEHILNWFHFLTGHPPMAQTLLLCNEETTSEEIISFLYRAFLCQYHVVFMIGKFELLNAEKRQAIINIINILFTGHEKDMKSCLVFAYYDKNSSFVKYLETIKGREKLEHLDKKNKGDILYEENVEIISSDKSGVGKSTYIKNEVIKSGKKYIHFPFGGEFNRKDVIMRLKDIDISNKDANNTVIHLDLYDSKQTDLMRDFLYSFLITKLYGQNEILFYLSKDVEIKIEIPCGFINFFLKFPILNMFKKKIEMKIDKLPSLIVDPDIKSNIQIVCNYLKLLKEGQLAEKDLYIKGVSLEPDDRIKVIYKDYMEENIKIDAISLKPEECEKLIKDNIGIEYPTYYQINCFINALSGQLKKFNVNLQLTAANLIQIEKVKQEYKNLKDIRAKMVNSFIKNNQHLIKGSFNKLLNSQLDTYKIGVEQGIYDIDKQDDAAIKALSEKEEIISFDKIKPSLIFFHEGEDQEFNIISTCNSNEDEYKDLLELKKVLAITRNGLYEVMGEEKREEIPKELNNYKQFTHKQFLKEIKDILSLKNPIYNSEKNNNNKEYKSIEEIVGEYVFTADNFIKMILILLHLRENIPVIMMGETGCGKTSLIRKLSELLNNGESKMKILNIHAGITDKEIVEFLFKQKKDGDKIIKSIIEEAEKLKNKSEKEKIWVFLDEINTCNCMGLICEMMTKHSCQGKELPNNIVFIGACNPYRMATKKEQPSGLRVKGVKERKLVYTVNPLPHSLLNFVFNFGKLTEKDEQSYIRNMIVSPIESFYWEEIEQNKNKKEEPEKIEEKEKKLKIIDNYISKEKLEQCNKLKQIASESIIEAQNYVREINDVSSVSLREIRRFIIFYNFFVKYLRSKKYFYSNMNQNENFEKIDINLTDYDIYKYSINLSIFVCYYLRLTKKENRDELSTKLNKYFDIKDFDFKEIPKKEQEFIANNIEIKEGIAKNKVLLENIFTLFVCVNAKVPLFIVGKPGCSKSLSVQLLFKSMKGEISDNKLFKTLPKLIINSYQGSLSSTSQGVLNIFKRARAIIEKQSISMIYFDEMGLAEHSPNNPLKVIHSELEYDLNEGNKKIAFVGISNWRLDASKMNRGLYLSIPQPDLEDLKLTSQIIAASHNKQLAQDYKELFENLAITYYEYKQTLNERYTIKEDFHGTRDFYHLINNVIKTLLKTAEQKIDIDELTEENIIISSLERNFGGLEFDNKESSLGIIKKIIQKKYINCPIGQKYDVLQKIKENINDIGSRYLLLISKSSISNYILSIILNEEDVKKDSIFYIGSRFEKDIHSEQYSLKILNKVQLQMEHNKVLLLKDLESVYPSLYDLFNQNFTVVSEKNYARIAIGSSNNTFSLVNDNFKCVVLVDKKTIENEEVPFLNRFEKHIISFEYLLKEELIKAAKDIYEMIKDLAVPNIQENNLKAPYDLKKLLVNSDKTEIQGIIYKYSKSEGLNKKLEFQDLQDVVLKKISLILPQDLILLMKYSGFEQKYNNVSEKIIQFYQEGEHNNLYNFIVKMENLQNLIYTFTSIDEPLLSGVSKDFETKIFGKIGRNNIKEIQLSTLSSEDELESELEQLYLNKEDKIKIIVFKFNPDESNKINYVKFFIENYIKEKNLGEDKKKAFIFTVHMNRIFETDKKDPKKKKYIERNELNETISHLSDIYQIFIDNLNGEDFSLIDILKSKNEELFRKFIKAEGVFMKYIYKAFSFFSYDFIINVDEIDKDNYTLQVIKYLQVHKNLRDSIINCVLNQKTKQKDILSKILINNITRDDVGIVSVIQRYLSELFLDNLSQFVFKTEKDHFLSIFIYNKINSDVNDQNLGQQEDRKKDEQDKEKKIINYMDNKLFKKLIEVYLQTLDISNIVRFQKQLKTNNITLLLGLKLPGMKFTLECLRTYIKENLREQFFDSEEELRDIIEEEDKDGTNRETCQKNIKNYFRNMEIEINKNELLQKLIEYGKDYPDDNRQLFNWLTDDYYLLYLSHIFPDIKNSFNDLEDYKKILKKMLQLRFDSENVAEEPIKALAMKMVWLESYNEYISIILNIYQKISKHFKDLYNKIENIIENKEIIFEISKRSPKHVEKINSPFFYIMESLLKIIITDFDFKILKDDDFINFINNLKEICQNSLRIVNELEIISKEIFTLQEFLNIEEKLNNSGQSNLENILNILKMLLDHSIFANNLVNDEANYKDLCDNIQKLYDFLREKLGETNNFIELILNVFLNEMQKIYNDNYRQKLIDIVLKNPKLLSESYPLLSFILKRAFNIEPESISKILEEIINNNKPYIIDINNTNNDSLNEIILNIFENQFNSYFDLIHNLNEDDLKKLFPQYNKKNPTCILVDQNLEIFKNCINFLERIYLNKIEKKNEKINNELICQLYCIAYIKIYLYKYIYYNHNMIKELKELKDFNEINKAIEGNGKNNFRKIIKIYIFKIFFYLLNNNYQDFKNYHYLEHEINFYEEFKDKIEENKESCLNYYLLPKDEEYNKYKEEFVIFESYIKEEFNKPVQKFKDFIENHGIDIFYTISINIIVPLLYIKDAQNIIYSKYSLFAKNIFDNQLKLPEITKKLFLLFANIDTFTTIVEPKLIIKEDQIDLASFEVLLYSLRICLQTSNTNNSNGFLYSEFLNQNAEKVINENVIPGNNILDNIFIEGETNLKNHFNKYKSNKGAYVCSCGKYYSVEPCGFTNNPLKCLNCNLPIGNVEGAKTGNMVKREGHYRIFKDQEEKGKEMDRYNEETADHIKFTDETVPNMLFEEYKTKFIAPIIGKSKEGISKIRQNIFLDSKQNVRNLSIVGYRLLNFILYSHLFFSNCLGFITNENLNNYICDGMTCLKMLVEDWNILKDALQSKGIQIIQIFFNMIFPKICEKLKNCKEMKTIDERGKFEDDIEKLLEISYKEYEKYSKEYLKINREVTKFDKNSMKSLMLENVEIQEYDEENYPFYKFFLMTVYPTKDIFINEFSKINRNEEIYPLLTSYISISNDNKDIKLLKYLPVFNEFVNFMIDNYSYNLSREEASKKILKEEDIYKNNKQNFKEKFEKFKRCWKYLKPYAIKYECKSEMPPIDLDENKSLAYFLNDNGEIGKGMYIAAAYQIFIDLQNQFLDGLIGPLKQNGILHNYVRNLEKKIDVQKAKENEVLNFDKIDEQFMEIIYDNCKRNIYREDNNINYMNYKQYKYDFDTIEKKLGELFLLGKVKFNDNLKFVTFCFEGFRGNKTSVLSIFEEKYKQIKLSEENRQLIAKSIKNQYKNKIKDLSKLLFSIQSLIYYLTQERKNEKDKLKEIIKDLPEYVNLSKECLDFIEKQEFKIEELLDVYSYIEDLCFKPITDNLSVVYKENIDKEKANKILKLFDEHKFKIITKTDLATACRRLISRYLVSKRNDIDYDQNNKLNLYLNRQEMWSGIWKEETEDIIKSDSEILGKEDLIVGQSYELYKLLGGDENKSIEKLINDTSEK